ncbi:MAG: hypothetical protein WCJ26_15115 [bacterium]
MKENDISRIYAKFAYVCGSMVLLSGIIYMAIQWIFINIVKDTLFISLSIGASIFILYFARNVIIYIVNNGPLFYTSTISLTDPDKSKTEYDKLLRLFTNFKLLIPFGILWGTIAGFIPLYFGLWSESSPIAISFGIFLFCICFITGFFLLILVSFFNVSKNLWDLIQVELWKRDNMASEFLIALSRKTSIVAAIYISICLVAWIVTPVVPVSKELIIYIIFSVSLLISSIIIPIRPFSLKLQIMKHNALGEIDEKIQKEYMEIIENLKVNIKNVNFDQMNLLIEMRKKIEDIQIYPYRIKTITASLSIIIISLFPVIVQFIFEKFFK